jgi:hypothetical protein
MPPSLKSAASSCSSSIDLTENRHSAPGTVVWPGGADLAPDTLYERVRTGAWPDQDVAA